MDVKIEEINKFLLEKGWSSYKLSVEMGLNYSFVYRILKKQADPGRKFVNCLEKFCEKYNLDLNKFIFFEKYVVCQTTERN